MYRWYRLLMRMYRIARSERFDMIQVRNSSAAGLAAIAIRRATGVSFAFQVSFPVAEWTTEAARRGDVRAPALRRIAAGLQRVLRKSLIRRAVLVLAISDRMRDELVRDGHPRTGSSCSRWERMIHPSPMLRPSGRCGPSSASVTAP